MNDYYINPDLNVVALIDPYDEESGDELSAHGKRIVEERLKAIGYANVIFCAEHEMAEFVAASHGQWVEPNSRPVAGWQYFDAPDAEVLTEDAGIDFTDPEMWA